MAENPPIKYPKMPVTIQRKLSLFTPINTAICSGRFDSDWTEIQIVKANQVRPNAKPAAKNAGHGLGLMAIASKETRSIKTQYGASFPKNKTTSDVRMANTKDFIMV